ncbi:MAG: DUF4359 domain-containing protein [Cyanobacteriota bacterium ELA615]
MKSLLVSCATVLSIGFIGCLFLTNPGQEDYEEYATEQMIFYVKDKICSDHRGTVFLQRYCQTLVDSSREQLGRFLSQKTQRHNYLLFSIYRTDLLLPGIMPRFQFQTIGILQNFYTFESDQI